jgi:lipopolysaccharide export LptBFGC system permease protein LptF
MTASLWLSKQLSKWILGCFFGLVSLLVLAESVEQARLLAEGGSYSALFSGIVEKLPLLVRDLLTPLMALTTGLFVVRHRDNSIQSLWISGFGRFRFLFLVGVVVLGWSVVILGTVEGFLNHQVPQAGQSEWVIIDGLTTRLSADDSGEISVLQLRDNDGEDLSVSRPIGWDQGVATALLVGATPAEASYSQLENHPHPMANSWRDWRRLSWFIPALLGMLVAAGCLVFHLNTGVGAAVALALGLGTQISGGILVEIGIASSLSLVFWAGGMLVLWRRMAK